MEWYGIIDRFEAKKAVILPEGSETVFLLDKSLLPAECQEGDCLRFDISVEHDRKAGQKRHVQDLIERLTRQQEE
ncbi:MAG TPA: DUF3006 domain-containing protein [Bacillota bacterium]|nr:DUF3006 domain-containing protein [Bacillota bacterium]